MGRLVISALLFDSFTSIHIVVIETLGDQDSICETEVYRKSYNSWNETSPNGAKEVGKVSNEPCNKKGERDSLGAAFTVILEQLRNLT